MEKKSYDILRDYKGSGNSIVDALALCIMYHRKQKIGLKAIHLKEPAYSQFRQWVNKNLGRPLEDDEDLMFDHVNIEKASSLQVKPMLPERFDDFTRNMEKTLILPNGRS